MSFGKASLVESQEVQGQGSCEKQAHGARGSLREGLCDVETHGARGSL